MHMLMFHILVMLAGLIKLMERREDLLAAVVSNVVC